MHNSKRCALDFGYLHRRATDFMEECVLEKVTPPPSPGTYTRTGMPGSAIPSPPLFPNGEPTCPTPF